MSTPQQRASRIHTIVKPIKCINKIHNYTNVQSGKLHVLHPLGTNCYKQVVWKCICECGKYTSVTSLQLSQNTRTSCGNCMQYEFNEDYVIGTDSRGRQFYIDTQDYEAVSQFVWCDNGYGYMVTDLNGKHMAMHNIVLNTPDGYLCDHIDGDRRNNRRCNLRICSSQQNMFNRTKISGCSSKYKGVSYQPYNNKINPYHASITKDNKYYHLGYYPTEEEAALVYNKKAKELFREYAKINKLEGDGYIDPTAESFPTTREENN